MEEHHYSAYIQTYENKNELRVCWFHFVLVYLDYIYIIRLFFNPFNSKDYELKWSDLYVVLYVVLKK